jgi:hypothetical protein
MHGYGQRAVCQPCSQNQHDFCSGMNCECQGCNPK